MTTPLYTAGPAGNVLATNTAIAGGKSKGAPLDVSAKFEAQVTCLFQIGNSAPNGGAKFEFYKQYGSTTTGGSPGAGATSITVVANVGFYIGQKIWLYDSANGELVTISNIVGLVLTVSATQYAHTAVTVAMVTQSPVIVVTPADPSGAALAINKTYSQAAFVGPCIYNVLVTNLDATNAIAVEITSDTITIQ